MACCVIRNLSHYMYHWGCLSFSTWMSLIFTRVNKCVHSKVINWINDLACQIRGHTLQLQSAREHGILNDLRFYSNLDSYFMAFVLFYNYYYALKATRNENLPSNFINLSRHSPDFHLERHWAFLLKTANVPVIYIL